MYLIPGLLDSVYGLDQFSEAQRERLGRLDHLIVESEKEARRTLKALLPGSDLNRWTLHLWNEHSKAEDLHAVLEPMRQGLSMGLMSDAGCPAVADPGSVLVLEAHRQGWRVEPVSGPSSLLLAWMASGLNGQRMEFHGYLPVDARARQSRLQEMEQRSRLLHHTQIWIETPYRNTVMLEAALRCLQAETLLCLACDLNGGPREWIRTMTVGAWNRYCLTGESFSLHKRPCVFLMQSP